MSQTAKRVLVIGAVGMLVAAFVVAVVLRAPGARGPLGEPPVVDHGPEPSMSVVTARLPAGRFADGGSTYSANFWATDDVTAASNLSFSAEVRKLTNIAGATPRLEMQSRVDGERQYVAVTLFFDADQLQGSSAFDLRVTFTETDGTRSQSRYSEMTIDSN